MTRFRIKIIGLGATGPLADRDLWLATWNVDALDGRGDVVVTPEEAGAATFPDVGAAWRAWGQQSRVRPLRPDGRPNRPLTAYTIEIEPVPEPLAYLHHEPENNGDVR